MCPWGRGCGSHPLWWLIKNVSINSRVQEGWPQDGQLRAGAWCFPAENGMFCPGNHATCILKAAGPLLTPLERSLEPVRASLSSVTACGLLSFPGSDVLWFWNIWQKERHHPHSPSRTQDKKHPQPTSEAPRLWTYHSGRCLFNIG